ncbi:MAG: hypothetical protein D6788_02275 [Planctomycetota bacterium]|nr:MAG: hypothetical protein D6788_02275 [Planctomycetota bacterium]
MVPTPTRAVRSLLPLLLGGLIPGCLSGSLATDTGPRPPGFRWSMAPQQMVHVGETVHFDFVLQDAAHRFVPPFELVDYVVLQVGGDRLEAEPDAQGHFTFTYRFDRVRPGDRIPVTASAYAQRGPRDFMFIPEEGRWLHNDSPANTPDRKLFSDSVILIVYALSIDLPIPPPSAPLDPESGVLRIAGEGGGKETKVYLERPHRPGFRLIGPDEQGGYRIRYEPPAEMLPAAGTVRAEFTVYDVAGKAYTVSRTLPVP